MESLSRKLLLIDSSVAAEALTTACKDNVDHLTFDFFEYDFAQLESDIDAKLNEINELNEGDRIVYTDVALVQHGTPSVEYQIVGKSSVAMIDGEEPFETFNEIKDFLVSLKSKGVERFDFLACALYSHVNMQNVFAHLESETGVDLRASTNFTGEYPEGDWIQESDNVDIRDNYFTEAISDFKEVLYFQVFRDARYENEYYIVVSHSQVGAVLVKSTGKIYTYGSISQGAVSGNVIKDPSTTLDITTFVNVYCAANAIAGLTSDGKVWAWGSLTGGGVGTTSSAPGLVKDTTSTVLTGVTAVYPSFNAFVAVKGALGATSQVYAWGSTTAGSLNSASAVLAATHASLNGTTAIYSNDSSFAAIVGVAGNVYAWGGTTTGGLGANATTPGTNANLTGITAIYSTFNAFAAVKGALGASSSVWAWGSTTSGHLGATATTPATNALLNGTTAIYSNSSSFAAIVGSGASSAVYAWGSTTTGHLGATATTPATNALLNGTTTIILSNNAYAAIVGSGSTSTVYAWGSITAGGLGANATTPGTNSLLNGATKVIGTAGVGGFAALVADRTVGSKVYAWGSNTGGSLSLVSSTDVATNSGLDGATDIIALGGTIFGAILTDRSLWAWGSTATLGSKQGYIPAKILIPGGLVNNPGFVNCVNPVIINGVSICNVGVQPNAYYNISEAYFLPKSRSLQIYPDLSTNTYNGVNVVNSGTALSFNRVTSSNALLGTTPTNLPGTVSKVFQTPSGAHAALMTDGTVWTWGNNASGSLTPGAMTDALSMVATQVTLDSVAVTGVVDIVASGSSFAALTSEGKVYGWGNMTTGGSLGPNATTAGVFKIGSVDATGVTKIVATNTAFAVIVGSGSTSKVYAWGNPASGGLNVNSYITPVTNSLLNGTTNIFATTSAFAALKLDGTVYAWGSNTTGSLGATSTTPYTHSSLNGTTNIYANGSVFAAIVGSGSTSNVYTWGSISSGHIGTTTTPYNTGLNGVNTIYTTNNALAAIYSGNFYSWGNITGGGLSVTLPTPHANLTNVTNVYSTSNFFAIKKSDGTLWIVGAGSATPITDNILYGIIGVYTNFGAMMFKRIDGTWWAWGAFANGGYTTSTVPYKLPITPDYVYDMSSYVNLATGAYPRHFYVQDANNVTYSIGQRGLNYYIGTQPFTKFHPFSLELPTPTITWDANTTKTVLDAPFTPSAPSSNSSGAFTYTSGNTSVATVNASSGQVTIVGPGTSTMSVIQAATSTYIGGMKSIVLTVNKATPTTSWSSDVIKVFGDATFGSTLTTNSTGLINYSSSNTSVATINSSGQITIVGAGNATLSAAQSESTTYLSSANAFNLRVNKRTPTLSWVTSINKIASDAPFTLTTPTSNSSGAFTYSSSDVSVVTVSGSTVTIVGAGTATLTATQATTTNYLASTITLTLTVTPPSVDPTQSWSSITKLVNDSAFTSLPTSNSDGAFTYSSSNTSIATINSSTGQVTILAPGTTTLSASQDARTGYNAKTVTTTLTVTKVSPTTSWVTSLNKLTTDGNFTLPAYSTNSTGTVSYTSSNTSVATVDNSGAVTFVSPGSTTITLNIATNDTYSAASASLDLTYSRVNHTSSDFVETTLKVNDIHYMFPVFSGTPTYTNSNNSVITITDITNALSITTLALGTSTISVSLPQTNIYNATTLTAVITVTRKVNNLTVTPTSQIMYIGNTLTLVPTSNSNGDINYSSSNISVARYINGIIIPYGIGNAVISVIQDQTSIYQTKTVTVNITVKAAVASASSAISEISGGNFNNAIESYKNSSAKTIKEIYNELKTFIKDATDAEYNSVTQALRNYILSSNDSNITTVPGAKVINYSSAQEINSVVTSMFDTLDTLPDKSIAVVYPQPNPVNGIPEVDISSLDALIKFDLMNAEQITIIAGGVSVSAVYYKLGVNSYVQIGSEQYRLGDVFQVGSKNIQIAGFGSVLLNEISNGTSGSGDPAIVTCTGKNYYLNNDIVNTCMLKPSSDSINAGKWKINCSTKKLSVADFPKKVLYGKDYIDREKCTWFGNNTYFDKLYISKGAEELVFDIDTHKIVDSTANIANSKGINIVTQNKAYYCPFWKRDYTLTPTAKYTEITISGVCKLIIRSDVATDDRSGIIVNNLADVPEKLCGVMVREEDMRELGELKC